MRDKYGQKIVRRGGNETIYRKLMAMKTADLLECEYTRHDIRRIREIAQVYRVDERAGLAAQLLAPQHISDCIDEELDLYDRTVIFNDF